MAFNVVRELASFLHASPSHTVMMDKTTDMSNCEQVMVFLRWVSEDFEANEELWAYIRSRLKSCSLRLKMFF